MPDSYAYLGIHFIFSTKERVSLISNEIKSRLFPYIGGIIKSLNCIPIEINGMPDHIHLFCLLSPKRFPPLILCALLSQNHQNG